MGDLINDPVYDAPTVSAYAMSWLISRYWQAVSGREINPKLIWEYATDGDRWTFYGWCGAALVWRNEQRKAVPR